MKWCERCGKWFVRADTRVRTAAVARGPVPDELPTSVCDSCLLPGEMIGVDGLVERD